METIIQNTWQKSKLIVKGLIIGILALLLLIPADFVQNLIKEREARQKEAFTEVSRKWADRQNITGPVLVIPYTKATKDNNGQPVTSKSFAYFLPDRLNIESVVRPEKRYRGIYEVMLYSSSIKLNGIFNPLPLQKLNLSPADMIWSEAHVCLGITDAKGLKDELQLTWNDSTLSLTPYAVNNAVFKEGFTSPVTINETSANSGINFSSQVSLNGSEQLLFTPVGKQTTVQMQSAWPDPSFTGNQLPDSSMISEKGFQARWKSLSHTRNFPQAWKDDSYNLSPASFGADLFIPVNGYQKTMRSVKYAILCILLSFTAFFLIETNNKKSVHPVHYALIGFALILFYTLLLSFSEYIGFNGAYAIATAATVGLITWFVKGLLQSMKLSVLLSLVLVLLYSYIFTILQLQDYALLLGSIGLFLTLAVVMYYSRKVQW
ncbi:MAG TPA: cell envelope integrity protein CreD [Chitinophagaceae bacterium]|jgi:inner membrane protein|nr:cell envelope integrity protein CreD [Chitinophagaceae bacterium]